MIRFTIYLSLAILVPTTVILAHQWSFEGAGGVSMTISKPDFGPINNELAALDMPVFNQPLILYGGQGYAHVSDHFRIGGLGFGGATTVTDFENGFAREASFRMGWGGVLMEYVFAQPGRFEFYGGGTLGWGGVNIHLEKSAMPQNWDGFWGSYKAQSDTTANLSSDLNHSFFLVLPRLGVRCYLIDWLAISGAIELPLTNLGADGWKVNDQNVYDAPSMNLISPVFQFSLLFGG